MIAYSYNAQGYYAGTYNAQKDPMQPGKFLLPAHATWTAPPANSDATKEAKWSGSSWSLVQSRANVASTAAAAQAASDAATAAAATAAAAAAALAALPTTFRQARNAKIQAVDWMRSRHQDQIYAKVATTLTDVQFKALMVYVQALRDLPEQPSVNMANPVWPTPPSFVH
jgi:hypothetical protein